MDTINGYDDNGYDDFIKSMSEKIKNPNLYNTIVYTFNKLNTYYGKDKLQYIAEYAGIDQGGNETVGVFIAGAVITFFNAVCDSSGNVIIK